ncbi:MAG TPA: TIGR03086 family metal-binding protein [Acidimicrobiia bacterium]|nr:TIGR03086 family metal-binding protein [Acidimicrobiia bacterium]
MDPADRHRRVAARFEELMAGTTNWDAPSPVPEWNARDVVRHLLEWFPPFLQDASDVTLAAETSVDDDPVAAWRTRSDEIQALLDAPSPPRFEHPRIGAMPFGEAIDRFYTGDVFLHSWDLARATGQDDTLDPETCAAMLAGMEPMEEVMRSSGHYGPRFVVPADADVQTRLIAFIGRNPYWSS